MALLAGLAASAFRALEQEMNTDEWPLFPRSRMLKAAFVMLLPMAGFIALFHIEPGVWGWLLAMVAYPFLALWCAVIYFENLNPGVAFARALELMRWGQGITLGFLIVNLGVLLFYFLDTTVWQITLQFFSWLVPPGEDSMRTFVTIVTTCAAGIVVYFVFLMTALSGALQYFSYSEIADAASLREGVEKIGTARQIRGLARE